MGVSAPEHSAGKDKPMARGFYVLPPGVVILVVLIGIVVAQALSAVARDHAMNGDAYRAAIEEGDARPVGWYGWCRRDEKRVPRFEGTTWCIDRTALERLTSEH